jgi:hypothetical protein
MPNGISLENVAFSSGNTKQMRDTHAECVKISRRVKAQALEEGGAVCW